MIEIRFLRSLYRYRLNTYNIVYEYLPLLSFYLFTLDIYFTNLYFQVIATFFVLPYFFRLLSKSIHHSWLMILFALMMVGGLFNMLNTSNGIGGLFILIGQFGLTSYAMSHLRVIIWHSLVVLIVYSVFIIYNILYLGVEDMYLFESIGLSRNHGGGMIVTFSIFFVFSYYIVRHQTPFVIPLLLLFPVYLCYGRSSIAATIVLAILCFIHRGSFKYGVIFIVILLIALYYWQDTIRTFYELSSFAEKGTYSVREEIWSSYFRNMDLAGFFFGPDTMSMPVVSSFDGNVHNTFLNIHRRFGIFVVAYFLISLCISFIKYYKKKCWIVSILLILLSFRAYYDSMFFIGHTDFVFLTMIYYIQQNRRTLQMPSKHILTNNNVSAK